MQKIVSCRKCTPKASQKPLFVNNSKQPLHARNSFKKNWYFERGLPKTFKKLTSFFLLNPTPFNRKDYEKQEEPGTCDQLLFRLQNKFRKICLCIIWPSLIMPYKAVFDLFQKTHLVIYASHFMKWKILSPFIWNLQNVEKREKIIKIGTACEQKELFR